MADIGAMLREARMREHLDIAESTQGREPASTDVGVDRREYTHLKLRDSHGRDG